MKKLTILFLLIIISCSEKKSKIVEQPKRNIDLIFDKISKKYPNFENNPIASDDLKLVARALLPAEIMEGSKLKYELMQYEIIE